jgi:Glycosyl hydrolase family 98/Secretion system C-terminal sorting domain/Glycosyl hydrolase family 98 C-terminal domain
MINYYLRKLPSFKLSAFITLLILLLHFAGNAQQLRRPVSPEQPMWLVHIDTWNYADPQKIIDLIPEDIRPFVVMNISLSISHDQATGRFQVAEYGYEIAKSWIRTCAQNQIWAMIQVSSGGYTQFSDDDLSVYESLFQTYPNLIGFNYAEQFWGYDDSADPLSPAWTERIAHFSNLLALCHQYGGYLSVSWCGNQWSVGYNPIAMLKQNPAFATACSQYTENYILSEKYTLQTYQSDMESLCLGAYLSGYSGAYGIRYDNTGWTNAAGAHEDFTMATALAPHLEHTMLTGETIIDGPELIWTQCFNETSAIQSSDGYTSRNWVTFPQFDNVNVEIFRKIIDGTVRIPTRQEVIDRTKYVIVNDVASGNNDDKYSSPQTLFEGLYKMDGDGTLATNKSFFKKTGRYPTIPTVYNLDDAPANSFEYQVNKSEYTTVWPTTADKVASLNTVFEEEYTGDLYAGRHENGWVVYNPYKTNQTATGNIPFKYNTCDSLQLSFSQYSAGVIKETAGEVKFYLNNYDNFLNDGLKIDIIKIYGSTAAPTYTYNERGSHPFSNVISSWQDGIFTLTVQHNGALDITVNCEGDATGRLTNYTEATITTPAEPQVYTGPLQYEAEVFDRKNVTAVTTNGYSGTIRNYTGQGYTQFGTSASAGLRDEVTVLNNGSYQLDIHYALQGATVNTIDVYVNGVYVATPVFTPTETLSQWAISTQFINLNAGNNSIELKASAAAAASVYFDNIVIANAGQTYVWMEAECGTVGSAWEIVSNGVSSNNQHVRVQEGNNSNDTAPTQDGAILTYNITVGDAGTYSLWGRVLAAGVAGNSFWVRMDAGAWSHWDSIADSSDFTWSNGASFALGVGTHTLSIAYSEEGIALDKIYLTNTTVVPTGEGAVVAAACSNSADAGIVLTASASVQNVELMWDMQNVSLQTQEIYRGSTPDFTSSAIIATVGGSVVIYTDSTVAFDQTYYYWIKGTGTEGQLISNSTQAALSSDIQIEAECGAVGSLWNTFSDFNAANDYYVTVQAGLNSTVSATSGPEGMVSFDVTVGASGSYALWLRLKCPGVDDNAFWIKIDNGAWVSWASATTGASWMWALQNNYALTPGAHTISIGYQEDGAKLDKIYLTRLNSTPVDEGALAPTCDITQDTAIVLESSLQNNQIFLSWALENTAFVSQEIYRSADDNFENSMVIYTLDGVADSFSDASAEVGVLYYYWVKGTDGEGSSLISNMVSEQSEGSASDIWMEVECGTVGSLFNIIPNSNVSNGYYVTVQPGNNSNAAAPTNPEGYIVCTFEVVENGAFKLWALAQSPSANDDSFYFKMDNGTWSAWNGLNGSPNWSWGQFLTYNLAVGTHTLTIAYREDGANLDKIFLTKTTLVPRNLGDAAAGCRPPRIVLSATPTSSAIVLNWNVENIAPGDYKVFRSTTPNFLSSALLTTVSNTTFTYSDASAQLNTIYYYWISGTSPENITALSNVASATLQISNNDVWLEAECATVGSLWNINPDQGASHGSFVTIQPGNNNSSAATTNPTGHVIFNFDIAEAGSYKLWARVRCPNASDDSFYLKMNGLGWASWNNITNSSDWVWAYFQSYTLTSGPQTLTVAYREDGAALDKLYLTSTAVTPLGIGDEAENCGLLDSGVADQDSNSLMVFPNPVSDGNQLRFKIYLDDKTKLKAYIVNAIGQVVMTEDIRVNEPGNFSYAMNIDHLQSGVYILRLQSEHATVSQKIVKK